ncbi:MULTISPECIES: hypothetical protein [unclassified Burkholderia]|uniref:hypothetical protein n=1 Tax=unclassified Burkholderia TaxID=2613784 RepID=UPI001268E8DE|nr:MULTISPECIES: hypothetical protein [unclassified Burkholderia]NIF75004.1 hypothetical protein [Burkholderia sp. Ap-962]
MRSVFISHDANRATSTPMACGLSPTCPSLPFPAFAAVDFFSHRNLSAPDDRREPLAAPLPRHAANARNRLFAAPAMPIRGQISGVPERRACLLHPATAAGGRP